MRILLFANNWGGWQTARWLREQAEDIVGVVVQPESDQRNARQILAALDLPADRIWTAPQLRTAETVSKIRALQPEIGICAWYVYLLKPDVLQLFSQGVVNLHAAYLPWNRGWHTNVYPILDGSPAGVTLHYIDAGVDTGDIIAQRRVPIEPTDTGGSLHQKLTGQMFQLFKETWPLLKAGKNNRTPQGPCPAPAHRKADLAALDLIELNKEYVARDLLNLLRARTYPPYPSAYFTEDSRRVYARVRFFGEEDLGAQGMTARTGRGLPCLDLEKRCLGGELLGLLCGPGDPALPSAYFLHESRPIYVRGQRLGEKDIDPSGTPAWMAALVS